jgi:hypothetical protein
MNMISTIRRGCDRAIDALRMEFGAVLAERIVEAEAVDFLWDARVRERYLGYEIGCGVDGDEASRELSRMAVLSVLDGHWYVALCLVNGEGAAIELLSKRRFECRGEAEYGLLRVR